MKASSITLRLALPVAMLCGLGFVIGDSSASRDRKQEIITLVDEAAALVTSKGEAAFVELQKPGSKWRTGDDYVFVAKSDGTIIFHAVTPSMVGQNQVDLKDVNGKAFVREMLNLVEKKGSGWVEYMWPKPGSTKPVLKMSYVRGAKLGDASVLVGAGYYPE